MIYDTDLYHKFWHRATGDRTFLEKIARRFMFPKHMDLALTWTEWERRKARLKRNFPIRWFFWETIPDAYRTHVKTHITRTKNWFRYRLKDRHHIVKTDLAPGYYDSDTRMIHAAFSLLVDFVEIELAAMQAASEEAEWSPGESKKRYYDRVRRFRRKQGRNPEAGLAYLDWEINESPGAHMPRVGGSQSEIAREKKFLYLWWTKYRKQRFDPHSHPLIWHHNDYDPSKDVFSQNVSYQYHLMHGVETFYDEEDQEMFLRLIKIRKRMWT